MIHVDGGFRQVQPDGGASRCPTTESGRSNSAERDKFFNERADSIRKDAEAAIAKVKRNCKSSQQKACDEAVGKIETARDDQLVDIDVKRAQAVVQ